MVVAFSVVSSTVVETHTSPCLCLDALPTSNMSVKNGGGELVLQRNMLKRKKLKLRSSFVDSWHDWRLSSRAISGLVSSKSSRKQRKDRRFMVVNEVAGQYDDTFGDVKVQILNYFTYKAVRTVLHQLYEMNPTQYTWFYNFVATNKPAEGKRFIRSLAKEKQELAERVMVTRLHLYGKWAKKCDHAEIYKEISDENLELMRERLIETVIWPSDDSNTEKIG